MLEDHKPAAGALAAGIPNGVFKRGIVVGRIQDDDVERAAWYRPLQRALDNVADDSTAVELATERGVLLDQLCSAAVALDTRRGGRATAQRFERHGAGAGEDV